VKLDYSEKNTYHLQVTDKFYHKRYTESTKLHHMLAKELKSIGNFDNGSDHVLLCNVEMAILQKHFDE